MGGVSRKQYLPEGIAINLDSQQVRMNRLSVTRPTLRKNCRTDSEVTQKCRNYDPDLNFYVQALVMLHCIICKEVSVNYSMRPF